MDLYSTAALMGVVRNLMTPTTFFLDRYFPRLVTSDTEEIAVDIEINRRRVAPFVSPLVQGKIVSSQGSQTRTFKPAYIKDKRAPDLRRPVRRAIGERIGGGEMSTAEREAANLMTEMQDQMDMLTRRMELMACEALRTGKVIVKGDGYDSVEVNFGRPSGNTVALTSTARWGESGVSPGTDIEGWILAMVKASGATVQDIVMDPKAWALFIADASVKDSISTEFRNGASSLNLGPEIRPGAVWKGIWGTYNLWVHSDWYIDPADDTEKAFLPDYTVMLLSPFIEGIRSFGTVMDPAHNYAAEPYAVKSWLQDDPAQRFLMMQSAPLMIPFRPAASFCATVR